MDFVIPPELEELILCCLCHSPFNDTDALPKLFKCRHHFCLKCINTILIKNGEKTVYCIHCWKRTELPAPDMKPENLPTYNAILYLSQNFNIFNNIKSKPPDQMKSQGAGQSPSANPIGQNNNNNNNNSNKMKKGENCLTHAMPNGLWCTKCHTLVCRACAGSDEHRSHTVKTQAEAKETIRNDITNELLTMQKTLAEIQHLFLKQRDFLLKILESCTALKTQIETELISHLPTLEISELRESLGRAKVCLSLLDQQTPNEAYKLYTTLHLEKQRLQTKHQEMYLQCKLDDLIRNYGVLFDFDLIKQALANLHQTDAAYGTALTLNGIGHHNPILLLANYCISQLYSRHVLTTKHAQIMNNGNIVNYAQVTATGGSGTSGNVVGQQQQQQSSNQQVLTPSPSHHDSVVVSKTFAELTGSPKSNSQGTNFSLLNESGLLVAGPPPSGQSTQQQQAQANHQQRQHQNYVNEMNRMAVAAAAAAVANNVPAITMMQHLQHTSQQQQSHSNSGNSLIQSPQSTSSLICNPSVHVYPTYFFNIEINGQPCGRILIEVRNDVAPKMAKNFSALATGEFGIGYKGCHIFQCWENESIITGDFELNNGRGGRSIFEEGFFMPDDTKILAIRGSVGMRRSQKRHDNMGLVGSQFRIILREMRGFTGIFAFVVEGLDLVEKISQAGDSAGKPQSSVVIVDCGKLQ